MNMESQQKKRATIRDVARAAGVSVSTVSRVFNQKDRVNVETRRKVQEAMERLNYVPSSIATSMITGKTKVILVMVPDFENPYYSMVLSGIESVLHENGYYSMVLSHNKFSADTYVQIQAKFDKMIDGIIAIPDSNLSFYQNWNKPCVIVDRFLAGYNLNVVQVDHYRGARPLTEELIHAGHRRIALVGAELNTPSISDRFDGFCSVLREHGIPLPDEYIYSGSICVQTGYQGTLYLMNLPTPPTALFAINNLVCIGCIQACQELGLRIGEDISLVGYDDHELSQHMPPGITVVRQPTFEIGIHAAKNLLAQLNETSAAPENKILEVKLIRRGSVKKIE